MLVGSRLQESRNLGISLNECGGITEVMFHVTGENSRAGIDSLTECLQF